MLGVGDGVGSPLLVDVDVGDGVGTADGGIEVGATADGAIAGGTIAGGGRSPTIRSV